MIIFPKSKSTDKNQKSQIKSPWIIKGITKNSQRKPELYEKYLKRRTNETKTVCKLHKNSVKT